MPSFLLALAGSYALLCLLVFLFQRRLVYFPGPPPARTPADAGLAFDELELATEDGETVHGWRVRAERADGSDGEGARGLVLHCHGNAGNVQGRIATAAALAERGFDVLLFDYRGFGRSTGSPDEEGTYRDAEAAYDWATGEGGYAPEEIVLFGESLGGAVATELACRRAVAGLVLESTFTSLPDVGATAYPFLPVRLLALDRYATVDKVGELDVPVLVLHGRGDRTVPFAQGERLARAAGTSVVELPGDHNDGGFLQSADLRRAVASFVERCVRHFPATNE